MFHVKHVSLQQRDDSDAWAVGKWQRSAFMGAQYVGICRCFRSMFHVKHPAALIFLGLSGVGHAP